MNQQSSSQTDALSTDERDIWTAVKRLSETALAFVAEDIEKATGLSGGDFGVLTRLEDLGSGTLPQHQLADSLGWNKARLSHHLTRMESRALVLRDSKALKRGVLVSILPLGSNLIAAARPVHAASIRRNVLDHINADEARVLIQIVRRMERKA